MATIYIAKVVAHYRLSTALDTWLLVNEPGQAPTENSAAIDAFREWLGRQYSSVYKMNAAWGTAYLGDHSKAAISYHFKTGHREAA